METMHAAGRRRLPPVPRFSGEQAGAAALDVATERFVLGPPTGEQPIACLRVRKSPTAAAPVVAGDLDRAGADRVQSEPEMDAAQRFVAGLRAAAADFAEAAGAASAVVREAVPPARHRRSRCRLVLRFADGTETDTLFLGPAGSPPGAPSRHGFDRLIRRWLGAGQLRDDAWLVADPDAPGGFSVDLTAWAASS
jgi:hypothetical protein